MTAHPKPRSGPSIGRFAAGLVGLFVLTTVGWMGMWAIATTFLYGSAPVVVSSGSMAPALDVGDLVVVEPFHGQRIHKGSVVVFDDQVAGRSIIHRVVEVGDGGTFTTRGDANPAADSTPLEVADIDASGRFLLPRMGLPMVWAQQGQWLLVLLALGGLALAVWLTRFALFDVYDPWLAGVVPDPMTGPPWRDRISGAVARGRATVGEIGVPRGLARVARRRAAEVGAVMLALVFAHATVTAYAAFAATTGNAANQFGAGTLAPATGITTAGAGCATIGTISLVGTAGVGSSANGGASSLTLPVPAAATSGDVLVAHVVVHAHSFGANPLPAPSGWTRVRTDADNNHLIAAVFWRVAGGSEPASYTFTNSSGDASQQAAGAILTYRGVDTARPIDAHGGAMAVSGSDTVVAPSVTATRANTRLLALVGVYGNNQGPATPSASMTKRYEDTVENESGVVETLATAADQMLPAAGASGTRSTTVPSTDTSVAQSIALRPETGPPGVTISWTPSSSSSIVDGYVIERRIGGTLDASTAVTPGSASSYTDTGLTAGTTYTYRVIAVSGDWRSPPLTTTFTPTAC